MEVVNLDQKFSKISDYFAPGLIASINNYDVRIAKIKGEFEWHQHNDTDELFMVNKGWFEMHFRDKVVRVEKGEVLVVPKGVEHMPVAPEECEIIMFEPSGTLNTGEHASKRTREVVAL